MFFASEKAFNAQEMLESISRSFVTRTNIVTENWVLWLIFLGVLVCIAGLFIIVKRKTPVAYFTTHNSNFAKKVLDSAKENNSIFDVQIEGSEKLPVLPMCVIDVEQSTFTLRSTKAVNVENIQDITGKKIRCSVLHVSKYEQGYYMLGAKIIRTMLQGTFLEITLSLPSNVEKIQRREHLRIEPKDEYILGIALWSEKTVNGIFVNTPEQWGTPEYRYIPGKVHQVRLMNISASGAKMIIGIEPNQSKLTLDKKCIILIDIWEPEVQQKVRYWIRCVEQNIFKIKDKNAIEIGVRFKEWTTTPLHDDSLHFVLVSKDREVPPLANWIMKRYLEQYKKDISAVEMSSLTTV